MKKVFVLFAIIMLSFAANAQNLQLHFDPRHGLHGDNVSDKNYFTTTFEMFKPDKWGSTFMFVDLDLNMSKGNIGLAYMEIARAIKIGNSPIMAHVEFNGGLASWGNIPSAYLGGAAFNHNFGNVNIGTYVAYKYHAFERVSNDVQWTVTWGTSLFDNKITLSGFLDVWTENKDRSKAKLVSGKKIVLLTEPQIWYNLTPNLSLGTEIEISNNFLPVNKTIVNPTLAAKWNF